MSEAEDTNTLRAPYDHVREAGYGDDLEAVKEILSGDDWYKISVQCTPKSLAAGAVYYIHRRDDDKKQLTQPEIAQEFGLSEPAVRSGWKHVGVLVGAVSEDSLDHTVSVE